MRWTDTESVVVPWDDKCGRRKRRGHESPEILLAWSLEYAADHCVLTPVMGFLFLQAYFFDAPEMDHLPAATVAPNQTVAAAK